MSFAANPPASGPPAQTYSPPPSAAHPHRWLVRSLIGVATVLGIVAIFAVWANRQLLDTGYWTSTNTKLIESPPIREAVSGYLTEQLYANVDVAGELGKELPSELKPLAAPAAGALKDVVQKGINLLLERPRVQELWSKANQVTHAQFVRLIENKGSVVKLPGGGAVVLDLRPMLGEVAEKVGAPASISEKIPANVAQLRIVTSKQLGTMQDAVNLLRSLALVLPLLVVAMFALAVYLARGRRRQTLTEVGAAFVGAGLAVVVVRGIAGSKVVDSLATTEAVRPAAQAAWSIGTSVLADVAWSTVFIGVVVVLAAMLAGPTRIATSLRHLMAPYMRDRPDVTFGALALLLLLLFAWGPIEATKSLTGILIIIVLAVFGTETLRRQTALEFPDAHLASHIRGGPHPPPGAPAEHAPPSGTPPKPAPPAGQAPQPSPRATTNAPPPSAPERDPDENPRSGT
ncbi:MAG TPA: hypothetical protein VK730_02905 [Solirubrobacteraceae bacterium]|nr:hypothetical protein [Solirubrobacteraceae bacterium]